jgi:hypothetical protein
LNKKNQQKGKTGLLRARPAPRSYAEGTHGGESLLALRFFVPFSFPPSFFFPLCVLRAHLRHFRKEPSSSFPFPLPPVCVPHVWGQKKGEGGKKLCLETKATTRRHWGAWSTRGGPAPLCRRMEDAGARQAEEEGERPSEESTGSAAPVDAPGDGSGAGAAAGDAAPVAGAVPEGDAPPTLSKNQQKKAARRAVYLEQRRLKRPAQKARAKANKKRQAALGIVDLEAQRRRANAAQNKKRKLEEIGAGGPAVVIDCDWDEEMTEKEALSMARQSQIVYATNMSADKPFSLHFSSLHGKVDRYLHEHYSGVDSWNVRTYSFDCVGWSPVLTLSPLRAFFPPTDQQNCGVV